MSDGLTADPLQRIWERVEDGLDIEDEFGGLKALKKQQVSRGPCCAEGAHEMSRVAAMETEPRCAGG
jgi:hypothetical protein